MAEKGSKEPVRYFFDDLTLDEGQRLVTRGENTLEVSGLTFDLLLAIVEAAPNIVGSDDLADKVWSGRPTSPETITQRAMMLRQALGDNAEHPKYVEVVRGRGFRLIPVITTGQANGNSPKSRKSGLAYATAAVVVIALAVIATNFWPGDDGSTISSSPPDSNVAQLSNSPLPVQRFELPLEISGPIRSTGLSAEISISPDGERIVFAARGDSGDSGDSGDRVDTQLYMRSLGDFDSKLIAGTQGARRPVFSSDGRWIVYSGVGLPLLKMAVDGGPPRKIAEIDGRNFGNAWSGNSILVSTSGTQGTFTSYLQVVNADGGDLEDILPRTEGLAYVWPEILPTGNHALYTTRSLDQDATDGTVSVIDLESLEHREILKGAYRASYVPTGHIVFGRDDDLWAARFDLESMDVVGDPVRMVSGVQQNSTFGDLAYDISDTGTLIYIRGESASGRFPPRKMIWAYRNGTIEEITQKRDAYYYPRLSPDGSTVAVTLFSPDLSSDIWTINLDDGKARRLTTDEKSEYRPIWSKDGARIIYSSSANDGGRGPSSAIGLRIRKSDGTGSAVSISEEGDQRAETLTVDGKSLIYRTFESRTSDIKIVPIDGSAAGESLISAPYDVGYSAVSPDGNWIAYTSEETGENQVYVRPFPNIESGKEVISIVGGEEPRWSADGSELFYRTFDEIWTVPVPLQTGTTFIAGSPELLLSGEFLSYGNRPSYDVSPDGQRFLVFADASEEIELPKTTIAVVTNWFEELERVLP